MVTVVVAPFIIAGSVLLIGFLSSMFLLWRRHERQKAFKGRVQTNQALLGSKVVRSDAQLEQDNLLTQQIKSGATLSVRMAGRWRKTKRFLLEVGPELRYWFNLFTGVDEMRYWANLVRCERATSSEAGMCPFLQGLTKNALATKAHPPCKPDETVAEFPRSATAIHLKHALVKRDLADFHLREGEEQETAEVIRENVIGLRRCNSVLWPELLPHARGIWLGDTIEAHCSFRTFALVLMGGEGNPGVTWTRENLRVEAKAFLESRLNGEGRSLACSADLKVWVCKALHASTLNLTLSDEDATRIMNWQSSFLAALTLPESVAYVGKYTGLGGVRSCIAEKGWMLQKYKAALQARIPAMFHLDDEKESELLLTKTASRLAETLAIYSDVTAQVLGSMFWLLFSDEGGALMAKSPLTINQATYFAQETARLFSPAWASAFSFQEPYTPKGQRSVLHLASAQRDPDVWGKDAAEFKVRKKDEYDKKSVGWAEPASAAHKASPYSRGCPAKELSIAVLAEFMGEFIRATMGEKVSKIEHFVNKRWTTSVDSSLIKHSGRGLVTDFVIMSKEETV